MQIEKIAYRGWQTCYRLYNDTVELIVTADVGPRVIHYAFLNGENVFNVRDEFAGKTGGDTWMNYGGHRLWHAPEDPVRTYQPDTAPVTVEDMDSGAVAFLQKPEAATGIQKSIVIEPLQDGQSDVIVRHHLHNAGLWTVPLSVWALSVMAAGGTAIFPLPERGKHPDDLLPANSLAIWAYTDLSDPRWTFGRRYILLRQHVSATTPQKIGGIIPDGWLAYVNGGVMFAKRFDYDPAGNYPDRQCNAEIFTNHRMLELESLSPLLPLAPGQTVTHTESWFLADDIRDPRSDSDITTTIQPLIDEHAANLM